VREPEPQPVVVVADELDACGPRGSDDDGVVRQESGMAVRDLALIDQHDMRSARRRDPEGLPEPRPRFFRDGGEPCGEVVFALMKVNDEMVGRDRAKPQRRIEKGNGVNGCREQEDDYERCTGETHCAYGWTHQKDHEGHTG